jgi:hypothetical protein
MADKLPYIPPQFSPMKTPLPSLLPADPPQEDEEDEEEEDPEKEESGKPESSNWGEEVLVPHCHLYFVVLGSVPLDTIFSCLIGEKKGHAI